MTPPNPPDGSPELRALYLDPEHAGVRWLLDPDKPAAVAGLRAAADRSAGDTCDASALAADLPDLRRLLLDRHIALGAGFVDAEHLEASISALLDEWAQRLLTDTPTTWGEALGIDVHRLRWLLGDNHLRAVGEDRTLVATADPRADEPVLGRGAGPVIDVDVRHGVLCVRIRQCGGPTVEAEQCVEDFVADANRHFAHERILVDVRSNPGGGDAFIAEWFADYLPKELRYATDGCWWLDDHKLYGWNQLVQAEAEHSADQVSTSLRANAPNPHPDARLLLKPDDDLIPAGRTPWSGRMMVLTDRSTASAAESVTWLLRDGFGARVVGGRSGGFVAWGDLVPYLLPRSGLVVYLASHAFGRADAEMVGLPVNAEMDPRTPLGTVAADFDATYESARPT